MSQERGPFSNEERTRGYPNRSLPTSIRDYEEELHGEYYRGYDDGLDKGIRQGWERGKRDADPFPTADVVMETVKWAGAITVVLIIAYVVLRIVGMVPSIFA